MRPYVQIYAKETTQPDFANSGPEGIRARIVDPFVKSIKSVVYAILGGTQ